jgi:hypothetical protein
MWRVRVGGALGVVPFGGSPAVVWQAGAGSTNPAAAMSSAVSRPPAVLNMAWQGCCRWAPAACQDCCEPWMPCACVAAIHTVSPRGLDPSALERPSRALYTSL